MRDLKSERARIGIEEPASNNDGASIWATFDRHLFHFGWLFGAYGAVAAFPFVVTHPHLPPNDPEGVLKTVLDFKAWLLIHAGLMFVLTLMLVGLAAIARSIRDERTSASAAAALIVAVLGTVFAIAGQGVDGVGFYVAAHVYRDATPDQRPAAVLMSVGVAGVAVGIFVLVLLFYFGLTSIAYGLVFARTRGYPKWIAALALLGGTLGVAAFFITYFDAFSDPVYYGLFIPSAVLFLLWVLAASLHLWLTQVRMHRAKLKRVNAHHHRDRPLRADRDPHGKVESHG